MFVTPEYPYRCQDCGHIEGMSFMSEKAPDSVNWYCPVCSPKCGGWETKRKFVKIKEDSP
jgi:hypothetical protein